MRKQTKFVAVASAAALLAIGASMTSFAATGWVEEDGQWYYYDNDGNRVEDEWKRSGENWYWLDSEENGAMATDKLVEDDDDTYYVDSNGVMVANSWVKVVNEDQDDDTDPAEYRYYYMQSNGKAYKNDKDSVSKKTIDGKKYAFDSEGKMLYGWVNEDNTLATGDEDWKTATYYFGAWNDGSMKTGWQYINVYDGWDNEDEDGDYWFYFGSNGKKRINEDQQEREADANETVRINGNRYAFTGSGEMYYKWLDVATPAADALTPSNWKYFNDPQSGARQTKGWFKVVPKAAFDAEMSSDGNDEAQWYYADADGELYVNAIKKISGKYYAFDEYGAMLTGLVHMSVDDEGELTVYAKQNDNRDSDTVIDADYLDDLKDGKIGGQSGTLYYFGGVDNGDSDGAMKTGNVSLNVDGTNYTFNFTTSGGVSSRGAGKTGETKDVYYKYGMKMAASSDDKYRAAEITTDADDNDVLTFKSASDIRATGVDTTTYKDEKIRFYDLSDRDWYLVGTNAKVKDKANGVKDGEDYYFFSDEHGHVIAYADDKDFSKTDKYNELKDALAKKEAANK